MPVLPPNAVVDPATADRALVAGALSDQPFAATTAMPPPPIPGGALTADQLMTAAPRMGEIEPGNIDLTTRPRVKNADGSVSTIRSLGVNVDGAETLIPTVSEDGRIMSDDEAVEQYRRTGRHLGKFDSVDASNAAAESLHNEQAAMGDQWGQPLPGGPSLSLVPPPTSPAEAAQRNVTRADELGAEQVANATEKSKQEQARADKEAELAEKKAYALEAITARQETHRREAEARTTAARAKAEGEPFHTFFENRSLAQNVVTGIGLILGGVSWNANHVNRGVQLLQDAQRESLDIQKAQHADMWRAVEAAEKGESTLDAAQLREVARFNAVEAAKHDAIASRLNAAIAMNKGKGDITTAKKVALEESEKANQYWQNATTAEASAKHQAEQDREQAIRDKNRDEVARIRAEKYKTKGGGGGGTGAGYEAAITAMQAAADAGKPLGAVIIAGKGLGRKEAEKQGKAIYDAKHKGDSAERKDLQLSDKDETRVVRFDGVPHGKTHSAKGAAKLEADDINLGEAAQRMQDLANDIQAHGTKVTDPGDVARRITRFANAVIAIGVVSPLGKTNEALHLETDSIGIPGGLDPKHMMESIKQLVSTQGANLGAVLHKVEEIKHKREAFRKTVPPLSDEEKKKYGHGGGESAEFPPKILEGIRYTYDPGKKKYVKDVVKL